MDGFDITCWHISFQMSRYIKCLWIQTILFILFVYYISISQCIHAHDDWLVIDCSLSDSNCISTRITAGRVCVYAWYVLASAEQGYSPERDAYTSVFNSIHHPCHGPRSKSANPFTSHQASKRAPNPITGPAFPSRDIADFMFWIKYIFVLIRAELRVVCVCERTLAHGPGAKSNRKTDEILSVAIHNKISERFLAVSASVSLAVCCPYFGIFVYIRDAGVSFSGCPSEIPDKFAHVREPIRSDFVVVFFGGMSFFWCAVCVLACSHKLLPNWWCHSTRLKCIYKYLIK